MAKKVSTLFLGAGVFARPVGKAWNLVSPTNLVLNPEDGERMKFDREPERGCWAVTYRNEDRVTSRLCTNEARPGRLTCKLHRSREPDARLLQVEESLAKA